MKKDYAFTREDGLVIRGRLYAPDVEKFPIVIFGHGFGSNYKDLEHHAPEMAKDGVGCLLIDFCGGGEGGTSDGKWEDMTPRTECLDMETVVMQIGRIEGADTDNVFVMGESLGGLVSALVAAKLPEKVRGAILWYPALELPDKVRRTFPDGIVHETEFLGSTVTKAYYEALLPMQAYEEAARYKGPVLIVQGDADDIVPAESSVHAQQCYENAALLLLPKAGHGFDFPDNVTAREASVRFILNHVE
ncbi:MAG: alpha/beta hydrolase [Lachnospiraceae bacterium]|nr:alpha/beta hydrolase [Lachnospiraceae bacterium]